DPRPEAAGEIFDERDRRRGQHTVNMLHLGYVHRAHTLTEESRLRHPACWPQEEPQRLRGTETRRAQNLNERRGARRPAKRASNEPSAAQMQTIFSRVGLHL